MKTYSTKGTLPDEVLIGSFGIVSKKQVVLLFLEGLLVFSYIHQ